MGIINKQGGKLNRNEIETFTHFENEYMFQFHFDLVYHPVYL